MLKDLSNLKKTTDNLNDKTLSNLIEKFYDIIFDKLEEYVPDGEYYADWSADERFIVFYDDEDKEGEVVNKSLRFANSLSTEIYMKIYSELNIDLKYDIGLCSGAGFLGLQGPRKFKKTTITGKSAGIAKRLEGEAKNLRKSRNSGSFPIIMMNKGLYEHAKDMNIFSKHDFQEINGTEKDIENLKCYGWQFTSK